MSCKIDDLLRKAAASSTTNNRNSVASAVAASANVSSVKKDDDNDEYDSASSDSSAAAAAATTAAKSFHPSLSSTASTSTPPDWNEILKAFKRLKSSSHIEQYLVRIIPRPDCPVAVVQSLLDYACSRLQTQASQQQQRSMTRRGQDAEQPPQPPQVDNDNNSHANDETADDNYHIPNRIRKNDQASHSLHDCLSLVVSMVWTRLLTGNTSHEVFEPGPAPPSQAYASGYWTAYRGMGLSKEERLEYRRKKKRKHSDWVATYDLMAYPPYLQEYSLLPEYKTLLENSLWKQQQQQHQQPQEQQQQQQQQQRKKTTKPSSVAQKAASLSNSSSSILKPPRGNKKASQSTKSSSTSTTTTFARDNNNNATNLSATTKQSSSQDSFQVPHVSKVMQVLEKTAILLRRYPRPMQAPQPTRRRRRRHRTHRGTQHPSLAARHLPNGQLEVSTDPIMPLVHFLVFQGACPIMVWMAALLYPRQLGLRDAWGNIPWHYANVSAYSWNTTWWEQAQPFLKLEDDDDDAKDDDNMFASSSSDDNDDDDDEKQNQNEEEVDDDEGDEINMEIDRRLAELLANTSSNSSTTSSINGNESDDDYDDDDDENAPDRQKRRRETRHPQTKQQSGKNTSSGDILVVDGKDNHDYGKDGYSATLEKTPQPAKRSEGDDVDSVALTAAARDLKRAAAKDLKRTSVDDETKQDSREDSDKDDDNDDEESWTPKQNLPTLQELLWHETCVPLLTLLYPMGAMIPCVEQRLPLQSYLLSLLDYRRNVAAGTNHSSSRGAESRNGHRGVDGNRSMVSVLFSSLQGTTWSSKNKTNVRDQEEPKEWEFIHKDIQALLRLHPTAIRYVDPLLQCLPVVIPALAVWARKEPPPSEPLANGEQGGQAEANGQPGPPPRDDGDKLEDTTRGPLLLLHSDEENEGSDNEHSGGRLLYRPSPNVQNKQRDQGDTIDSVFDIMVTCITFDLLKACPQVLTLSQHRDEDMLSLYERQLHRRWKARQCQVAELKLETQQLQLELELELLQATNRRLLEEASKPVEATDNDHGPVEHDTNDDQASKEDLSAANENEIEQEVKATSQTAKNKPRKKRGGASRHSSSLECPASKTSGKKRKQPKPMAPSSPSKTRGKSIRLSSTATSSLTPEKVKPTKKRRIV